MIYLFYGPNEYGRQRKLSALLEAVLGKNPQTAIARFSLDEEGEVERLYDFIVPRSLFESAKRIAVVKNSDIVADDDIFKRIILLLGTDKESVLVFNESWDKKDVSGILKKLIESDSVKEFFFDKLTNIEAKRLAIHESKTMGIEIESSAVDYLLSLFNGNLFSFINEAKKLSFLGRSITKKILETMDEYQLDRGIYEFSSAVVYGAGLKERLSLWEQLMHQRTDSYIVLNYLAKGAKNLSLIKKIADVDVSVKTGLLEPEQALLAMLLG
jgi:DNA polymerase III delta subunit